MSAQNPHGPAAVASWVSAEASPGASREPAGRLARCKRIWRGLKNWSAQQWRAIRPGPEAWRGAVAGCIAAAAATAIFGGLYLRSGFGYAFDFAFAILAASIIFGLTALGVALAMTLVRKMRRVAAALIAGCCTVIAMLWGGWDLSWLAALTIGLIEGILGATLATIFSRDFATAATSKRVLVKLLCAAALLSNAHLIFLFAHSGNMDKVISWKPPADGMPAQLAVASPAENGPYRVLKLFYGAGNDIRRPEYGSGVAIKTRTVDASDFMKDFGGWKRWARKKYWGFDIDKLPLNARVWYPEGPGPFPLALIVHGNHEMSQFSDPGYAYLGELLASRGFILASIDENFLNSGLFHDPPKQQAVRGWMLLEHLKLWREWNTAPGNPFFGKVDMTRIALMGHSRGGEAAATAAAFNRMRYAPEDANIRFDYGFPIKAVVAIAPADGQYKPAEQDRWIDDVSYLTIQGAHDADVSEFMGSRQWDHVRFTQPGPWFKAEIYAYRANHGQFNTVWGRSDAGEPLSWLLNRRPLMSGEEQRRISKTYISAFLETTLNGRREYLPLFEDWRAGRDWLPQTIYLNRYQAAGYQPLAAYMEDADLTTTTAFGGRIDGENLSVWREGRIPWREGDRGYNGVFLGWNRGEDAPAATYTLTLPRDAAAKWGLGSGSTLELSVAAMDEDAPLPTKKNGEESKTKDKKAGQAKEEKKERESPDFTLELVTSDGATAAQPVSHFLSIPPPLKEMFTKLSFIETKAYEKDWEPVFQTVRAPLSAFAGKDGKALDASKLAAVRLRFDRTKMNVICVSGIGFGKN
jgi:dienelactone hydrolase